MRSHLNNQQVSKLSQKTKNNQQILSKLKVFWQTLHTPNQQLSLKMKQQNNQQKDQSNQVRFNRIEQSQQSQKISKMKNRKIEKGQKISEISTLNKQGRKIYQIQKKTPFKENFSIVSIVFISLLSVFMVAFCFDFNYQFQNELEAKTNQINQCYEDFHLNNCLEPLEALISECQRLQLCSKKDPKTLVKASSIFVKIISSLISIIANHLGLAGMAFVILLVLAYFYRPIKYHQEKIIKYQ